MIMSIPQLKRKKKVNPNPNPLFTQWLTQWRDEAAEKGIKTQYAFGKALRSLKKYPMPLASGKSCSILESFGDKICKMLDRKLEAYIAENGPLVRDPVSPTPVNVPNSASIEVSDSDPETISTSHSSLGEQTLSPVMKKRKRKKSSPREYVPLYRSGPYALILALYKNHIKEDSRGFMHKEELMEAAQPLTDKSFTRPDPGSYYTAWSSMSTLINKGYVSKERNPARFSITESGCELAHRLQAADEPREERFMASASTSESHCNSTKTMTSSVLPNLPNLDGWETDDMQSKERTDAPTKKNRSQDTSVSHHHDDQHPHHEFLFWYIDDRGRKVSMKDSAAVMIDDDIGVGFLVKCKKSALVRSGRRYKESSKLCDDPGDVFVYLANQNAEDTCTVMMSPDRTSSHQLPSSSILNSQATASSHPSRSPVSSSPQLSSSSSSHQGSVASHSQSSSVVVESSQDSDLIVPPDPLFVFQPGEFEVVLCVDNCETAGGGHKKLLLPELMKNGVTMDVRKLQVGDFLWVAREKLTPKIGQLKMPEWREVVLDYVVERKRMDDLCSSMQDGRFREQKFRLKNCGLRKPIYLVEEHGASDRHSIPQATLFQATVNTQISDGFFVKQTKDIKESVAYLTIMTRYLQNIYMSKTLIAYKKDHLEKMKWTFSLSETTHQLLTFKEFNQNSVKNKESSVNETFAKQLLQISGLSAEKALAISSMYKTPACLFEAYDNCAMTSEKEKLLAKLKYGKLERNLGPVLSKQIHQLYCSPRPLI